ncbi:MAG: hypothetical protein ABIR68_10160 [Ilumatobacteraceae bacterium]
MTVQTSPTTPIVWVSRRASSPTTSVVCARAASCRLAGARRTLAPSTTERWRVLVELARSDRRVDELTASAGSVSKPLHPNAVRVLAERGLDIRGWCSKSFANFAGQHFDHVVTLCDKVRERCPEFADDDETIHWSVEDPSDAAGTDRRTFPRFRRTAAELEARIGFLVALIDNTHESRSTP